MHDEHHDPAHAVTPGPAREPTPDTRPDAEDGGGTLPPSLSDLLGPTGRLASVPHGRKRQVLVRFTDAELADVERRAAEFAARFGVAVDVAAFCHLAARFPGIGSTGGESVGAARRGRGRLSREDALDLVADLVPVRRILSGGGTNLNQLALHANSGEMPGAAEIAAALERQERALARLNAWMDLLDPRHLVHRPRAPR